METMAAATETPEGFSDAEWQKFERFEAAKKAKRIEAEREKAALTTAPKVHRNESSEPYLFASGCTAGDELLPKDVACDGTGAGCRQRRNKPLAAPGETFRLPAGHRRIANPALPEVDPASVANEPTAQDRLLLGELRSVEQRADVSATLAARTLADLTAQERILQDRKLQQQEELDRRRSHVEAAKAKTEEFLGPHSEVWCTTILGGAPEAALETAKRAADADRGHVGTMADLRRNQAGDEGPGCFTTDARGNPVRLKVSQSS
jgi:hypothetical protein